MDISPEILNRKGARKPAEIPAEVLELLNAGRIETVNLSEWLGVDQLAILRTVLGELDRMAWYSDLEAAVLAQKKPSANNNTRVIGEHFAELALEPELMDTLAGHTSDVVRCWACWATARQQISVEALIQTAKPFAADPHFGVREVVIFASKERMAAELETAINLLEPWTASEDENVRRFVAEAMRPVGVWTKKITRFQETPALGLPLLEPLKADPSRYVQNSVANWLNDASKSQPAWVEEICAAWSANNPGKATQYIVKRGLRTLRKK